MLHLRAYRNFPDVFTDRREQRYLTPRELEEVAAMAGPAVRSPWLLTRLTAKGAVQRFLSSRHDHWVPENALDVQGPTPVDGRCSRLHVTPDGVYGERGFPALTVRVSMCESTVFCATEPARNGKHVAVALQAIDSGFPFFLDEPLAEEEIARLADAEEELRNGHVAASIAVKRAVLSALGLERAGVDPTEIIVGPIEYGQPVRLRAPADLIGRRRIFAWSDVVPSLACAYAAILDADYADTSPIKADLEWVVDPHKEPPRRVL